MFAIYSIVEVLSGVAISLGVGASTFALLFYFMGMKLPELRQVGRPYSQAVYTILRIAMVAILLTELAKVALYVASGASLAELFAVDTLVFTWTLVAALFANAILMTLHVIPMKVGPALQATSWYTLGVVTALPLVTFTYLPLLLTYLGCVLLAAVVIEGISKKLAPEV